MKTPGLGASQDFNRGLLEKLRSSQQTSGARSSSGAEAENLSEAEQKMIRREFNPEKSSIDLYGSSGSVRTENPGAKGGNIDFTV
ncbi:MAG: hypothetical protein U5K31_09060 [Balneolaceae bacterium]|nr:hypothetical protein [Balneolaceae bacterium]